MTWEMVEEKTVNIVTPPDLFIEGKPKVLLIGEDDSIKMKIVEYVHNQYPESNATFYFVDKQSLDYEAWLIAHINMVDYIVVIIDKAWTENLNSTNHLLLGSVIGKEKTVLVCKDRGESKYATICKHLCNNPILDSYVEAIDSIIKRSYVNNDKAVDV